jgi:hypothetical protein
VETESGDNRNILIRIVQVQQVKKEKGVERVLRRRRSDRDERKRDYGGVQAMMNSKRDRQIYIL